jgi:SAM-dependent methyltransferase
MSFAAFDSCAADYDRTFTDTKMGRELRGIVWRYTEPRFHPGARVLELNCGTGEDAIWLARRNIRVVATDSSTAMLQAAAEKSIAHGLSDWIEFRQLDLEHPGADWAEGEFEGALSNFGGFNCIENLRPIIGILSHCIRPGGHLLLVVMGRYCLWEMLWHIFHLQPRVAFRRLRDRSEARIGNASLQVWYRSLRMLRRLFQSQFELVRALGLGVFLPPSYLQEVVLRRPTLFSSLVRLESAFAAKIPFRYFGDHLLLDLQRTKASPRALL